MKLISNSLLMTCLAVSLFVSVCSFSDARAATVFPIATNASLVQVGAGLTTDGTNYLLAFASGTNVCIQLVLGDGTLSGSVLVVVAGEGLPAEVQAVSSRSNYLVAWSDSTISSRSGHFWPVHLAQWVEGRFEVSTPAIRGQPWIPGARIVNLQRHQFSCRLAGRIEPDGEQHKCFLRPIGDGRRRFIRLGVCGHPGGRTTDGARQHRRERFSTRSRVEQPGPVHRRIDRPAAGRGAARPKSRLRARRSPPPRQGRGTSARPRPHRRR